MLEEKENDEDPRPKKRGVFQKFFSTSSSSVTSKSKKKSKKKGANKSAFPLGEEKENQSRSNHREDNKEEDDDAGTVESKSIDGDLSSHSGRSSLHSEQNKQTQKKSRSFRLFGRKKSGSQKSFSSLPSDLSDPPLDDLHSTHESLPDSLPSDHPPDDFPSDGRRSFSQKSKSFETESLPDGPPPPPDMDDMSNESFHDDPPPDIEEPIMHHSEDEKSDSSPPPSSPRNHPNPFVHTNSQLLQTVRSNLKHSPFEEEDTPVEEEVAKSDAPTRSLIRGQSLLTPVPAKVRGKMRPSVAVISESHERTRLSSSLLGRKDDASNLSALNTGLGDQLNIPLSRRRLTLSTVKTRQAHKSSPSKPLGQLASIKEGFHDQERERKSLTKLMFDVEEEFPTGNEMEHEALQDAPPPLSHGEGPMEQPLGQGELRPGRLAFRQSGEALEGGLLDAEAQQRLQTLSRKDEPPSSVHEAADDSSLVSSLSGGSSMFLPRQSGKEQRKREKSAAREIVKQQRSLSLLETSELMDAPLARPSAPDEERVEERMEVVEDAEVPKEKADKELSRSERHRLRKQQQRERRKREKEEQKREQEELELQRWREEEHRKWAIRPKQPHRESLVMRLFAYVETEEEVGTKKKKKRRKKMKKKAAKQGAAKKSEDNCDESGVRNEDKSATVKRSSETENVSVSGEDTLPSSVPQEDEEEEDNEEEEEEEEETTVFRVEEGTLGAELLQLIVDSKSSNNNSNDTNTDSDAKKKLTLEEKLLSDEAGELLDEGDYLRLLSDVAELEGGLEEGLEYWEMKHAGLGDLILNNLSSCQPAAAMLHRSQKTSEAAEREGGGRQGGKPALARSLSSLTSSMAPLKIGAFDPSRKKLNVDIDDAEIEEKMKSIRQQRFQKSPQKSPRALGRKFSLFLEEGSDLDSDEELPSTALSQSFVSSAPSAGAPTARDISRLRPEEAEQLLSELEQTDSSVVSLPETPRGGGAAAQHCSVVKSRRGERERRARRFKELLWGRAAEHMQRTTRQVDPLLRLLREEARLQGEELLEEQFGERYSRKSRWEGVEFIKQQERQRLKREKALERATALL